MIHVNNMTSIKLDLFAVQSNKLLLKSTFQKNLASIRLTEMHQTIVFWHKIQSEMKIIVYWSKRYTKICKETGRFIIWK